MASVIPDTLDFSAYVRETDPKVKVRRASLFADQLAAKADPRQRERVFPHMLVRKLGQDLQFRPGEVTCWAGYNGHRKSMFTGQAMLDLCVQRQRVLAASFEMVPVETLFRMSRQAFGLALPAKASLEHFARWTDDRLWIFDHIGRITPDACMAVCRYFADELKGQHVFIDSMMMVCASEEKLDEQKQFTTDILRLAQETGLHVHVVVHCRKPASGDESKPPGKYDIRGSAAISDQAHNVVTVWADKAKKAAIEANPNDMDAAAKPDALVTVEKQRNGRWEGRVRLWFDENSLRFTEERTTPIEPYRLDLDRDEEYL
jgi:twinkle protein